MNYTRLCSFLLLLFLGKETAFLPLELFQGPNYHLRVAISEPLERPGQVTAAITGATIELYNCTKRQTEWTLTDHPDAFFQCLLEPGNKYTMLVQKEGYLCKRMDLYVKWNGCTVCVDGATQGLSDRLESNEISLLFELEPARVGQQIQIQPVFYDYDQWKPGSRAEASLQNLLTLLTDNPGVSVELGSCTDSRGNDAYNQKLSQRRAEAAVAYLLQQGLDSSRISARGYGEGLLVNRCKNGIPCTEEEHRLNRRTILRITALSGLRNTQTLQQRIETANQPIPPKHLQEANTSVPLPPFKPQNDEFVARGEAAMPLPVPRELANARPPSSIPGKYQDAALRILQLPATFKGIGIELTRSDKSLPLNDAAFQGQNLLFRILEKDGKYSYLIANLGPKEAASAYFTQKIKPFHHTAKLVFFTEKGKEYFNP